MHSARFSPAVLVLWVLLACFWVASAAAQEPIDDEMLRQGAQLYNENCAVCHGEDGQGRVGATLAQDWPAVRPDLRVRETIVNGVPGSFMPPWSQPKGGPLTDAEIDAMVAYILSWQEGGPTALVRLPTSTARPTIVPLPDVEGDPNRGAVIYDQNCAVCHGLNGEGRVGATLVKDWPAIRPDLSVKNIVVNGIPGSYMPAWSQNQGGPLTESEINDTVAFILSWSPTVQEPAPEATTAPTFTPTPEVIAPQGGSVGLIIGGVLVVIIIIGGVAWASRRS